MPRATEPRPVPLLEIRVVTPLSADTGHTVGGLIENAIALRPEHLVIDLTECEYVDAVGIGLLLDVHRRIWHDGGRLSLRGMSPRLQRILQLARVDRVLNTATAPTRNRPGRRRPTTDVTPFGTTR
jgi:anti-anti-sigma factor